MLAFFRTYQRFFFTVITVIIIISFSFFGTTNTILETPEYDPAVFTAVDGSKIKRSEVEMMAHFLTTDASDKIIWGGAWGANFLNDGVLQNDFLKTGLAETVVKAYAPLLREDYYSREQKEKAFKLYHHPAAEFVSVENAWNYLSPDIQKYFRLLQTGNDPLASTEFQARVSLYLAERQIPAQMVKQILLYQKKQYPWLKDDPELMRKDLSLFGYHTVEDWFGPRFLRIVSAIIINGAREAKSQGYLVSDEEATAMLIKQAQKSFDENKKSPYLGVANADDYLKEQLNRMRLSPKNAIELWKDILLFRRLMDGSQNSILTDRTPFLHFANFANAYVAGDLYTLPDALQLSTMNDLGELEIYLALTSKSNLPNTDYLPLNKVAPELLERQAKLEIASINKKQLAERVGVREMWKWQVEDAHWKLLQENFADLGRKKGETEDARFAILETLDAPMREKVDRFSREAILKERPEWIQTTLASQPVEVKVFKIRAAQDTTLKGIDDSRAMLKLLEEKKELQVYTQDNKNYYNLKLLELSPKEEIVPFAIAKKDGILRGLLEVKLEKKYQVMKDRSPSKFQNASGGFKPLNEVKEQVFREAFPAFADSKSLDETAQKRLLPLMVAFKEKLVRGEELPLWNEEELSKQWSPLKKTHQLQRGEKEELFALKPGNWSDIETPANGAIYFFFAKEQGVNPTIDLINKNVAVSKNALGTIAKEELLQTLIQKMKENEDALHDYLNPRKDNEEMGDA